MNGNHNKLYGLIDFVDWCYSTIVFVIKAGLLHNSRLSKVKILQIGLEWFPEQGGGLDRYFYDCVFQLPYTGLEAKGLVAGSAKIAVDTQGLVKGFAPAESSLIKRLSAVRICFKQALAREDFELIVSHFTLYTFPLLSMLGDRPLVTHFHGPWALESGVEANKSLAVKVKKWLEKSVYKRSQQFIVLSETFRDVLHQEYQVPLEKIHIIPGGVDIERFNVNVSAVDARRKLGWEPERPTIFCIRRLARRMGLENLATAMAQVSQVHPDVQLYIAGKGELAATLQAQISELGLDNHVKLLGYVSDADLPLCYRGANFSVVPTVALEGFGLIVVESLAAGTPVLGTPIGGIPEILRPFSEDLVFAGIEPQQLAQGMIEALSGDRILPSSPQCLKYVQENYHWQTITKKIKLVYQAAMN